MIINNSTVLRTWRQLVLVIFAISITLFSACSDDPDYTNEEEVVTTVIVTLDPVEGVGEAPGEVITLSWNDANLDAIVDANELITSGPLVADETYHASTQILNSEIDITEEIREEAEEHIFCFRVVTVGISVSNPDVDRNGLPLGLTSTWTTTALTSSGTVNIVLRHQPGVKTGDCPGAGDTDIDLTFDVMVESDASGRL